MLKRLTTILLAMVGILAFSGCSASQNTDTDIAMPSSSSAFKGEHYEDVVEELRGAGFTNIETRPLGNLITGWLRSEGEVEKIRIAGDNTFYKGDKFPKDAKILITYHSFPEKDEEETSPTPESEEQAEEPPAQEEPNDEPSATASDKELIAAVKDFHEERADSGVVFAKALADVTASNGVVSVTYDPTLSGIDAGTWHSLNPFDNMARFACDPFAWSTPESTHLRTGLVRVDTFWADGSSAGSMSLNEIKALNGL